MKIKLGLLMIVILLLVVSVRSWPRCNSKACLAREVARTEVVSSGDTVSMRIGTTTIQALVRDTESERSQGLSGKQSLRENEGMLFIFEEKGKYGFWMKDMNFPIDILWLDGEKVVGISENLLPSSYPEVFYPPVPVNQVLEVPAGFALRHNIDIGDFLVIGH